METTTRAEHIAWCKTRALEYLDQGDTTNAWNSMVSDLGKHEATQGHAAVELGTMEMMMGGLSTPTAMRTFIEGIA